MLSVASRERHRFVMDRSEDEGLPALRAGGAGGGRVAGLTRPALAGTRHTAPAGQHRDTSPPVVS
jgi:hypothetical protein